MYMYMYVYVFLIQYITLYIESCMSHLGGLNDRRLDFQLFLKSLYFSVSILIKQ